MTNYQVMPDLTPDEYSELKNDIAQRGVMVPIEFDELGNVLDGYHRLKICAELGIKDFPKVIRAGMTEAQKLTHARKLNMARRQLTGDQKRELIRDQLKATPEQSDRQIAKALGVSHPTVSAQRKELEKIGDVEKFTTSTDTLGREQPRYRKPPTITQDTPQLEITPDFERDESRSCEEKSSDVQAKTEKITCPTPDFHEATAPCNSNTQADNDTVSQPVIALKPVTVFNPTNREISAMKNPQVVARMQVTGANPVKAEKDIQIQQAKTQIENQKSSQFEALLYIGNGINFQPDSPYDLLLTDPPYSTDVEDIDAFALSWLPNALAHVKPTGSAYVFIGAYPDELRAYLNVHVPQHIQMKQVLIWTYKNTLGNNPKDRYKLNYQACLFFRGVNAPDLDCPLTSEQWAVQEFNAPDGRLGNRFHAWQKPIEIAERFIRHSTKQGDTVFDPFACTGTFLLAASNLGRKGYGFEINPDNAQIAKRRGVRIIE